MFASSREADKTPLMRVNLKGNWSILFTVQLRRHNFLLVIACTYNLLTDLGYFFCT